MTHILYHLGVSFAVRNSRMTKDDLNDIVFLTRALAEVNDSIGVMLNSIEGIEFPNIGSKYIKDFVNKSGALYNALTSIDSKTHVNEAVFSAYEPITKEMVLDTILLYSTTAMHCDYITKLLARRRTGKMNGRIWNKLRRLVCSLDEIVTANPQLYNSNMSFIKTCFRAFGSTLDRGRYFVKYRLPGNSARDRKSVV